MTLISKFQFYGLKLLLI